VIDRVVVCFAVIVRVTSQKGLGRQNVRLSTRLHNEELNYLNSPNIVRVIKSMRMRWTGHVARMLEERRCIRSWWGNRREIDQWGDLGADGWIILGWISRRWDVGI